MSPDSDFAEMDVDISLSAEVNGFKGGRSSERHVILWTVRAASRRSHRLVPPPRSSQTRSFAPRCTPSSAHFQQAGTSAQLQG